MAFRIQNRTAHRLRLDVPHGEVIVIAPHGMSPAVREELFYDNVYLREWVAKAQVVVHDAPMAEVWAREGIEPPLREAPPAANASDSAPEAASAPDAATGHEEDADETGESPAANGSKKSAPKKEGSRR